MKTSEKRVREPLFYVVKRDGMPFWQSMIVRVIAVAAALLLCSLLSLLLIGANPLKFLMTMVSGSFGTAGVRWTFAKDAAVLLCIALAITPAFRMRFWNIGAEGQTLIGAFASVAVVFYLGNKLPNSVLLVLMFVASVLAGALWGVLPAIFKAKWGTNETLFTLMMNYVATGIVALFLNSWTHGSGALGRLSTGYLPTVGHQYFLIIAVVLVITALMYIYLRNTKHGYEIAVVGESENTARYIGIGVGKIIIRTMIVSGAVCGMAGFLIVSGLDHSVTTTTVGGMGFTAIMVSWLAKFNPLIMIGTSAFIMFLQQGAAEVVTIFNVDSAFPNMVVGIALFFIIGCEFFIGYRIKFRKSGEKKEKGGTKA